MKKKDWNFQIWCRAATIQIVYKPDRKRVYAELMGHLEDAYDTYIAQGLSPDDAEQKALESMGKAREIAPQLAAVYKPFWGYMLQVSQILLVVLLVLSLIPLWKYAASLDLQDAPQHFQYDVYSEASYGGDTGRSLHHLSRPDVSFSTDGSTFTVTDAALYTEYSEYYQADVTRLIFLMRQTSILPWQEHKQYSAQFYYFPITTYFFVRDNMGNEYAFYQGSGRTTGGVQSGIFTYTHECWINDFPADAQWAEICYERDGRSFVLRIDLTGGDPS